MAKMPFEQWCPGHETETQSVVDHGEPSRGQIQALPVHTGDGLAVFDGPRGQSSIRRNPRLGCVKVTLPQCIEKDAGEKNALGLALGKTLTDESLNARIHCLADLLAKAGRAKSRGLTSHELTVKPCGSLGADLFVERQIGTHRQGNTLSARRIV